MHAANQLNNFDSAKGVKHQIIMEIIFPRGDCNPTPRSLRDSYSLQIALPTTVWRTFSSKPSEKDRQPNPATWGRDKTQNCPPIRANGTLFTHANQTCIDDINRRGDSNIHSNGTDCGRPFGESHKRKPICHWQQTSISSSSSTDWKTACGTGKSFSFCCTISFVRIRTVRSIARRNQPWTWQLGVYFFCRSFQLKHWSTAVTMTFILFLGFFFFITFNSLAFTYTQCV